MDLDLVVVKIRGNLGNARKKSIFLMGGVSRGICTLAMSTTGFHEKCAFFYRRDSLHIEHTSGNILSG